MRIPAQKGRRTLQKLGFSLDSVIGVRGSRKKRLAEFFDGLNSRLGSWMKDFGWPEAEFLYRHEGGRQRGP